MPFVPSLKKLDTKSLILFLKQNIILVSNYMDVMSKILAPWGKDPYFITFLLLSSITVEIKLNEVRSHGVAIAQPDMRPLPQRMP